MENLLAWMQASAVGEAMRGSLWLYPIVEIVHITGFVLLVGSVAMFDLRLLGCARALPVRALGAYLLPWSVASLLLVLPAGLMMFSAHPHDFIGKQVFQLKLLLIAVAGLNAGLFHIGAYRRVAKWDVGVTTSVPARLHACASPALWIAVICCGRLIAYM